MLSLTPRYHIGLQHVHMQDGAFTNKLGSSVSYCKIYSCAKHQQFIALAASTTDMLATMRQPCVLVGKEGLGL